jgi:hypothetical protein
VTQPSLLGQEAAAFATLHETWGLCLVICCQNKPIHELNGIPIKIPAESETFIFKDIVKRLRRQTKDWEELFVKDISKNVTQNTQNP